MLAWHATKNFRRGEQGLRNVRNDFKALLDGVLTGHYHATEQNLRKMVEIIDNASGGPHGRKLAKWAHRGDTKKFLEDREAVWRLIEHQLATGGSAKPRGV
jgi:hypothetical protein